MRRSFKPQLEVLGDRLVPDGLTFTWAPEGTSTNGGLPANWTQTGDGTHTPGSGDLVKFDAVSANKPCTLSGAAFGEIDFLNGFTATVTMTQNTTLNGATGGIGSGNGALWNDGNSVMHLSQTNSSNLTVNAGGMYLNGKATTVNNPIIINDSGTSGTLTLGGSSTINDTGILPNTWLTLGDELVLTATNVLSVANPTTMQMIQGADIQDRGAIHSDADWTIKKSNLFRWITVYSGASLNVETYSTNLYTELPILNAGGTVKVSAGTLEINGADATTHYAFQMTSGTVDIYSGRTIKVDTGEYYQSGGTTILELGANPSAAAIQATGTNGLVWINGGTLQMGSNDLEPYGNVSITGPLTLGSTATFETNINALNGVVQGKLSVNGQVTLAGTLTVNSGGSLGTGNTWTLITETDTNNISGDFGTFNWPTYGNVTESNNTNSPLWKCHN